MEVHMASGCCKRRLLLINSFAFVLSLRITGIFTLGTGAQMSVHLAHSICDDAENEDIVEIAMTTPEFRDGLKALPIPWNGSAFGIFKKTNDSQFQLRVVPDTSQRNADDPKFGLKCYSGSCKFSRIRFGFTKCQVIHYPTNGSIFEGNAHDHDFCNIPEKKCLCDFCGSSLCNNPNTGTYRCGPPHPCLTPSTPAPNTTTTTTTTTTTKKPTTTTSTTTTTREPGPSLSPPKFSCYVADSCNATATIVEAPDFPECVVAHFKGGVKKFHAQKVIQGKCDDKAEKCDFCFRSICNAPTKYCKK